MFDQCSGFNLEADTNIRPTTSFQLTVSHDMYASHPPDVLKASLLTSLLTAALIGRNTARLCELVVSSDHIHRACICTIRLFACLACSITANQSFKLIVDARTTITPVPL